MIRAGGSGCRFSESLGMELANTGRYRLSYWRMSEPHVQAITYFAKALGSARSGDADGAQAAIAELAELRDQLREKKDVASALSAWMITKSGPSSRSSESCPTYRRLTSRPGLRIHRGWLSGAPPYFPVQLELDRKF